VKKIVTLWLPPLAWMAVIAWLSTERFGGEETATMLRPLLTWALPGASPTQVETMHGLIRKGAHLMEFGILASLWFRALIRGTRATPGVAAGIALAVSVGWAVADEWHQSFVPNRTASPIDVAIDSVGALASLALARSLSTWVERAASLLLWAAAAGGVLAIVANHLSGVDSGPLWVTVPVAAALLVLRRFARGSE
jgi:VanZ family protein